MEFVLFRDLVSKLTYSLLELFPGHYGRAFSLFREKKRLYELKSRQELIKYQKKSLISLLKLHSKNVIYSGIIKKTGIPSDENFDLYSYLSGFPILTKEFVQTNFEALKTTGATGVFINSSGGSTGTPVNFWQDRVYSENSLATTYLSDSIQLWRPGCREARLWGAPKDIRQIEGLRGRFFLYLKNQLWLDSFNMGPGRMQYYHDLLEKFRPEVLISYASSIFLFAQYLKEARIKPDYGLRSIISSAETLYPNMRGLIEEVFGVKVFNRYGSREVGNMASECEMHDGMHLHMYDHIIETIPAGKEANEFGKEGELAVTCLTNYSMPVIRYKIGDTGLITGRECRCKSGALMLEKLYGRTSDSIFTKDKNIIHGEYFTHIFYGMKGIREFQFVQRDYENYEIRLLVSKDYDRQCESVIREECARVLGGNINLEIKYADAIEPLSASGKRRFTISMLDKTKG